MLLLDQNTPQPPSLIDRRYQIWTQGML
jgi:hypothetical protein